MSCSIIETPLVDATEVFDSSSLIEPFLPVGEPLGTGEFEMERLRSLRMSKSDRLASALLVSFSSSSTIVGGATLTLSRDLVDALGVLTAVTEPSSEVTLLRRVMRRVAAGAVCGSAAE
uniref:(northern house mosquito) hypothetical protein n=1 Tax=Culex pipiens TaxID=7175 RepID=A0A8D7ZS93_CULPI